MEVRLVCGRQKRKEPDHLFWLMASSLQLRLWSERESWKTCTKNKERCEDIPHFLREEEEKIRRKKEIEFCPKIVDLSSFRVWIIGIFFYCRDRTFIQKKFKFFRFLGIRLKQFRLYSTKIKTNYSKKCEVRKYIESDWSLKLWTHLL